MSTRIETEITLSPAYLADLFWELDASEQADFFAALDAISTGRLCIQMAAVVREIKDRADMGDRSAQNGFQTMLSHAQDYAESATDFRVWSAQRHIAGMVAEAKAGIQ